MAYIRIKSEGQPEVELHVDSLERDLFISEGFGRFLSFQEKIEKAVELREEDLSREIEEDVSCDDDSVIDDYFHRRSLYHVFLDRFVESSADEFITSYCERRVKQAKCREDLSELESTLFSLLEKIENVSK